MSRQRAWIDGMEHDEMVVHPDGSRSFVVVGAQETAPPPPVCCWCREAKTAPHDVMCAPCRERSRRAINPRRYVLMQLYVIRCMDTGRIKIGVSADAKHRLRMLQESSPTFLELVSIMSGNMCLEQELHKRFANYRVRGEWFAPGYELLEWVATLPPTRTL